MYGFGNHIGYFRNLVATELAPFFVFRYIFLFARVVTILFLELLNHGRMIAIVPCSIFAVLNDVIGRPQCCRQHHIHKTVIVDRNTIHTFYLTDTLDAVVDVLAYFVQCRSHKLVITHIGSRIGQTLSVAVHAHPVGMVFFHPAVVHGPHPCNNLQAMLVSHRDSLAVVFCRSGFQNDTVQSHFVHHLTDRVEIHFVVIMHPCPEHGIFLLLCSRLRRCTRRSPKQHRRKQHC